MEIVSALLSTGHGSRKEDGSMTDMMHIECFECSGSTRKGVSGGAHELENANGRFAASFAEPTSLSFMRAPVYALGLMLVIALPCINAIDADDDDSACFDDECDHSAAASTDFIPTTIANLAEAAELARIDRAMDDGTTRPTVILITINEGYLSFFRNWLLYFMELGYGAKFLVMCEDQSSFGILYNAD